MARSPANRRGHQASVHGSFYSLILRRTNDKRFQPRVRFSLESSSLPLGEASDMSSTLLQLCFSTASAVEAWRFLVIESHGHRGTRCNSSKLFCQ